jgi:hypothetical protein
MLLCSIPVAIHEYNQGKKDRLSASLRPTVNAILPDAESIFKGPTLGPDLSDIESKIEGYHLRLTRPYVIFYAGSGSTDYNNWRGVTEDTDLKLSDIRTLILLEESEFQSGTYVSITSDSRSRVAATYHRYNYYLWAYDMHAKKLGAFTSLKDPELESEYLNSEYHRLSYQDLCKWADSVTVNQ